MHAIAPAPTGGIYVGTSPQGKIYASIRPAKSTVFFDPDDRYIWSLAVDRQRQPVCRDRRQGCHLRITPDGKGTVFYQTKATHAMTPGVRQPGSACWQGPNHRAGSSASTPPASRSSSSTRASTKSGPSGSIAARRDVRDCREQPPGSHGLHAGATEHGFLRSGAGCERDCGSDRNRHRGAVWQRTAAAADAAQHRPGDGRHLPDQPGRRVGCASGNCARTRRTTSPFEGNGSLLVATGNKGKIYRLSGEPYQPTLVVRANVQQVTAILPERDGRMLFATANPGKLLRLSSARADRGTYTSDVRDATDGGRVGHHPLARADACWHAR